MWDSLSRLVEPLDDVRAVLHHRDEAVFQRAGAHAAGMVLAHRADSVRAYLGWTEWDWAKLCGSRAEEFIAAHRLPTQRAGRQFLVALGSLLGGFTGFQHLGKFNRLHLAHLVFGLDPVEESPRAAGEVLDQWGYRSVLHATPRWHGVFSQALLTNGSPRLEDLSTEAFARLGAHPATSEHHGKMLFALQRAVAALGHCDPPARTGRNALPVIEGADAAWVAWVDRWYATSTLTPRVRSIVRTLMATSAITTPRTLPANPSETHANQKRALRPGSRRVRSP